MSLATGMRNVAKNLTKSLGVTAVLKNKTIGSFDPITGGVGSTVTDVTFNLASWEVSKPTDSDNVAIGDMVGIGYFDDVSVIPNKEEIIEVASEEFKIYAVARYQAQGTRIAYKLYAKTI